LSSFLNGEVHIPQGVLVFLGLEFFLPLLGDPLEPLLTLLLRLK
jgi:hypothetical protein